MNAVKLLNLLGRHLAKEERLIICGFRGDPDDAVPSAWRPRPWKVGVDIPFSSKNNGYVAVSSFIRAEDGSFRRRQGNFAAGLCLMVDDVGTKVKESVVKKMPPTAILETSPKNYQWVYVFREPLRDQEKFDALIRAFIRKSLMGSDPGMAGVTRVFRLPGYTNGKAKHNKFLTRLELFEPDRLFTVDDLVKGFKLELLGRRMAAASVYDPEVAASRIKMYFVVERFLRKRGMMKRKAPDPSGWQEIRCPFIDNHTGGANTGAAIREPHADNQNFGAFRCHHGHCADKGWSELTDWINEIAVEEVN